MRVKERTHLVNQRFPPGGYAPLGVGGVQTLLGRRKQSLLISRNKARNPPSATGLGWWHSDGDRGSQGGVSTRSRWIYLVTSIPETANGQRSNSFRAAFNIGGGGYYELTISVRCYQSRAAGAFPRLTSALCSPTTVLRSHHRRSKSSPRPRTRAAATAATATTT